MYFFLFDKATYDLKASVWTCLEKCQSEVCLELLLTEFGLKLLLFCTFSALFWYRQLDNPWYFTSFDTKSTFLIFVSISQSFNTVAHSLIFHSKFLVSTDISCCRFWLYLNVSWEQKMQTVGNNPLNEEGVGEVASDRISRLVKLWHFLFSVSLSNLILSRCFSERAVNFL